MRSLNRRLQWSLAGRLIPLCSISIAFKIWGWLLFLKSWAWYWCFNHPLTWESCGLLRIHLDSLYHAGRIDINRYCIWPRHHQVPMWSSSKLKGLRRKSLSEPVWWWDMGNTNGHSNVTPNNSSIYLACRISGWFHSTRSKPWESAPGTVVRLEGHLGNPAILRFFFQWRWRINRLALDKMKKWFAMILGMIDWYMNSNNRYIFNIIQYFMCLLQSCSIFFRGPAS